MSYRGTGIALFAFAVYWLTLMLWWCQSRPIAYDWPLPLTQEESRIVERERKKVGPAYTAVTTDEGVYVITETGIVWLWRRL